MQRDLFNFHLPAELIAQQAPANRRDSRLLTLDGNTGIIRDRQFTDVLSLAAPGDLLVFNDTRVIPARLFGAKQTGGRIEILVERMINEHEVLAHIKSSKTPKVGSLLNVDGGYQFRVIGREREFYRLVSESAPLVSEILADVGHIPLPPYIQRQDNRLDVDRYQTVYAKYEGAVAAPTAGLHFDLEMLEQLEQAGINIGFVTLHVGAGTFQPLRSETIEQHQMHSERFEVSERLCDQVRSAKAAGKRVIAVGTTCVRALESVATADGIRAQLGETDIFIYPGYEFQVVDAMLTNFHLPESTLIVLISAFAGREKVIHAYEHAIRKRYRFFSYGDAMWITRNTRAV
ncbi:MAG: tRNA preQ1(34) S-adenosylmethionine ribosyltransferase-isomerase QueA [Proteobacteria bacterium]|nr:tRNA preQ1(34) S-adenosylmethionine ribosyltransferase-isomerase QueA [Pseudomonadota bacterium]